MKRLLSRVTVDDAVLAQTLQARHTPLFRRPISQAFKVRPRRVHAEGASVLYTRSHYLTSSRDRKGDRGR